jgi:hypothetical protein
MCPLLPLPHRAPQYDGSLITAEGLEEGMMDDAMPPAMRENISQQYKV